MTPETEYFDRSAVEPCMQRTLKLSNGSKVVTKTKARYVIVEQYAGARPKVAFYRGNLAGAYEALGYVSRRTGTTGSIFDMETGQLVREA